MRLRRATLAGLTLAGGLLGGAAATPALAAPGDFTIVYDWTRPQTGFAGVQAQLSAPALETPYYRLSEQPGAGLRLAPAVSASNVADRVFPPINPVVNPYGGPSLIALVNSPPTTQVKSASFSQLSYRRAAGETQIMRLAIFGPGGSAGLDTRSDAPSPGPFLDDVTYDPATFGTVTLNAPGAAGNTVQAWLFTSCGDAPAPPACPTVRFPGGQPDSFGQVGKIQIALHDSQPPAIALGGDLAQGGWTNARLNRNVQITATDQGSGMRTVLLQRRAGTSGPFRTLLSATAACNRNHTGAGEPGREATECPSTLARSFTQAMGGLGDGQYQYRVTATDDSGLASTKTFTVRIDRRAPRATFGGGPFHLGIDWLRRIDAVPASVAGTDDRAGIVSIDLVARVDGHDANVSTISACGTSTGCPRQTTRATALPLGSVPDGDVKVRAIAHDAAGNTSAPSASAHIRLDRVVPDPLKVTFSKGKQTLPAADADGSTVALRFRHSGGDATRFTRKVSGLQGYQVTLTDSTFTQIRGVSPIVKAPVRHGLRHIVLRASKAQLAGAYVLIQAIDEAGNASTSISAQVVPAKTRVRARPLPIRRPHRRPTRPPADIGFTDDPWGNTVDDGRPVNRVPTVNQLITAVKQLVPRRRFISLRAMVPYDLWKLASDDRWKERGETTGALIAWRNFVKEVTDYNSGAAANNRKSGAVQIPLIEPIVVLRSHNFDQCTNPKTIRFADPLASPPPPTEPGKRPPPDPNRCRYPAKGEYAKYFQQWLDSSGNGATPDSAPAEDRLHVRFWGAWNEPDNKSFTLADIVDPSQSTPPGATIAAQYWVDAQRRCGSKCEVLAGEFAGYSPAWVTRYEGYIVDHTHNAISSLDAPEIWTIHAYSALLSGDERKNIVRDYIGSLEAHDAGNRLRDFKIWITETGALLNVPGPPTVPDGPPTDDPTNLNNNSDRQFAAGQQFKRLGSISRRVQRVFYYGAWAPARSGRFDDQLADSVGKPRPVLCGIGAHLTCNGDVATK